MHQTRADPVSAEAEALDREARWAALLASESRLRTILESATDYAIVTTDLDGRITLWNAGARNLLGWEEAEALGRDARMMFTPEDRQAGAPEEEMERALAEGRATDERWHMRKDGGRFWASGLMMPLRDGRLEGFLKILRDRTGEQSAEAALRASEERFRAAVGTVDGVLWTNNAVGEMRGEQPGWAALTGQSFDNYQGYGWATAVHPDDAAATIEAWNRAVAERRTFVFEHRVRRHDGAWRRFAVRANPILALDGSIREWVGVHTDITEQREAEEALRDETLALETLNRVGAILAAELDLEKIVQAATDAAVEVTGAAFGAFFYNVLNEQGESYMLYTLSGVPREAFSQFPMPRNTAIFDPTFRGEGPVRIQDVLADPRYGQNAPHSGMPEGHLPVRSYLATPVASRSGEILGGLFFGHPEPGIFTHRAERLAVGIAAQAAIAIDNARLHGASQRANATLEAMVAERTEQLRASEEAALRLYNGSPVPQHSIDSCGRYLAVSDGWLEMMGYTREEVIGRPFFDFVPPDWQERLQAAFQVLRQKGQVRDFEYELIAKDGTRRPVLVTTRVERDPDGNWVCTYGVTIDLRERKAAEAALAREAQERRKAEEALQQAQKLQALGQLTGGIAHDFNNLLTVIQGSADFLKRKELTPERRLRYIDAIIETAARAASLTHQLLAFARKQPLKPEVFDLNQRIIGMSEVLRRTLGVRYEVVTDLAGDLWPVEADPTQLEVAVLNIGVNARDAMPDGGTLEIKTRNVVFPAEEGGIAGEFVCMSFQDTGTGMSAEVLEHVFEPFFTTKEAGKGTGLGLSQIYGFAAQSGGDVRIESGVGLGTTVILHLPRAKKTLALREKRPVELLGTASGRVLLVEDNAQVGEFASQLLEELGYDVVRVAAAAAALELIGSGEPVDVVLTDVVMPGMTGTELASELARLRPDLPVLLTTGHSEEVVNMETGGREVLVKPYGLESLAAAVSRAMLADAR